MSLFIVFEGGEGCGKSTQAGALYKHMLRAGISVALTHEPGGTPLGKGMRRYLKRVGEEQISPLAELFLIATIDSRLVGTAMAGYDGHRGWVYYVAVAPQHRRKGVATALMKSVEENLVQLGCHKLNLQVRAQEPEAVAFYQTLGYRVEQRVSMGKLLRDPDDNT